MEKEIKTRDELLCHLEELLRPHGFVRNGDEFTHKMIQTSTQQIVVNGHIVGRPETNELMVVISAVGSGEDLSGDTPVPIETIFLRVYVNENLQVEDSVVVYYNELSLIKEALYNLLNIKL